MKYIPRKLEHLGLIAAMCDELGIAENIDQKVGQNRRKVSVGRAVKAMIVNALGFTGRALYLTPNFFKNRLTDILIGDGILPADLNDDSLGTALDILYDTGLNETFFAVSSHALKTQDITHKFAHLDSTTFSLHGRYNSDEPEDADGSTSEIVRITKGHSKDNAPELNQVVVMLMTTYQSSIPLWISTASGNASDKKEFAKTIQKYRQQLREGSMPCMVMDSAFYTAENLQSFPDLKWVTRVPETIREARLLLEQTDMDQMQQLENGYRVAPVTSEYAGVTQRWLVVHSPQAREQEIKSFNRNLEKLERKDMDRLSTLQKQDFACEADALAALEQFAKTLKFHLLDFKSATPRAQFAGKGRPARDQSPAKTVWNVIGHLEKNQNAIAAACARKGNFIIATNELDAIELTDTELLGVYKAQGVSVERGFRFLKDPLFYAESLYLNNPKRIMALIMVMGISLLVYALLEKKLRQSLKDQKKTIRSQTNKPTNNPTIRWVFMLFENVLLLEIQHEYQITRHFVDPPDDLSTILNCLGIHFKNVYCVS